MQYLLPSSCHPSHTFKSVPYSLALRLVRICSDQSDLKKRLTEFENMLLSRNYNKNIIRQTIAKALELDRMEFLKKAEKAKTDRVVLAITYHPKLPSVSSIIKNTGGHSARTRKQKKCSQTTYGSIQTTTKPQKQTLPSKTTKTRSTTKKEASHRHKTM